MPFRCVHLSASFILRQVFDLFFISLLSLKLCASHYTQSSETTYFRCRHYTQYYQARIFFSFHYRPYNLCTSHYNQPFKTIPFSCVYLIIPFHFQGFFSILLHLSIIQRTHFGCADLPSTCYFVNFWVVASPTVLQDLYPTKSFQLAPPACAPPMPLCGEREKTGLPCCGPDCQYLPLPHRDHPSSPPHSHIEGIRGEGWLLFS